MINNPAKQKRLMLNVLEDSKFIEFKQGPYDPEKDKTLF